LVLLSSEILTNTNTSLTVSIVFQYNTSHIVHLCDPNKTKLKSLLIQTI
jgi:hypothetical protein